MTPLRPAGEEGGHGPEEEFGPWCVDAGREHDWSAWEIGPFFPREERFCSMCGGMETQEISADGCADAP